MAHEIHSAHHANEMLKKITMENKKNASQKSHGIDRKQFHSISLAHNKSRLSANPIKREPTRHFPFSKLTPLIRF